MRPKCHPRNKAGVAICAVSALILAFHAPVPAPSQEAPTAPRPKIGFVPKEGFVPNGTAAVKIAEAVIEPAYGLDRVMKERPFKAKLVGGEWFVTGSSPTNADWLGGVAEVHINRTNGCITFMTHGR